MSKKRTPGPRLISKAAFARRVDLSRQAIGRACKRGSIGVHNGKINLDDALTLGWLADRGIAPTPAGPWSTSSPEPASATDDAPTSGGPSGSSGVSLREPRDVRDVNHLTVGEIVARHGAEEAYFHWIEARKKVADTARLEIGNAVRKGELIERAFVATHVLGFVEGVFRRLLGDTPKTIARKVFAISQTGGTVEQAEAAVREGISAQLRDLKSETVRRLRAAVKPK